jgi:chemotaxis protein MotD
MMDISVSGGAAPAEAPSAKSNRPVGKDDDGRKGGFSDVLSKAGDSSPASNDAQTAQGATAGGTDADEAVAHPHKHAKPIIDLSDASLKEQAAAKPETVSIGKTLKEAGDQIKEKVKKDDPEKPVEDVPPHAEKATKPAKGHDTAKADTAADDAASDVLDLLKKDAPQQPVTILAAMHGAAVKSDEATAKGKDGKTEKVDANGKTATHASDALAAISGHKASDVPVPGTEGAEASDGKTFRISRADGRGQSMDVHIGTENAKEDGVKIKGDVENVTVLESRRYLGLAQNSASVTAAISGDKEWAQAMQPGSALSNAAEWTSTGKVVNTLKIQMTPIDLGLVTATMRLSGDALNVDLKVETGSAYRQLKEDHSKILEALRSQGYTIDNVTISMAPVEKTDTGTQANAQGQSGQQSLQQGQGGEARERQSQTAQRGNGGFDGAAETGVDGTASGSARSSSSGGVYL